MQAKLPERIVCLTEETTETLYLLGEQDRIVGISGFTVRPPQARREKPRVSAFISAKIDKILDLEPDLVIGFSDMQADIASALIREGVNVLITNQRSVAEILSTILQVGTLVGAADRAQVLVEQYEQRLSAAKAQAASLPYRPKVYFEEWNEPLICGIRWVSDLIQIAGGEDVFADMAQSQGAKGRIIADGNTVIERAPQIIIGSWCGKKFNPDHVRGRDGWLAIPAVQNDQLYEIKSVNILQPGPAALTDGVDALQAIIQAYVAKNS